MSLIEIPLTSTLFSRDLKWSRPPAVMRGCPKNEHIFTFDISDAEKAPATHVISSFFVSKCSQYLPFLFYRRIRWKTSSVEEIFCLPLWPAIPDMPWLQMRFGAGQACWPLWPSPWRMITLSLFWGTPRERSSRWSYAFSLLDAMFLSLDLREAG